MTTQASATVKGGLFEQYGGTVASVSGVSYARREIARLFSKLPKMRELLLTLDGVDVAGTPAASASHGRIEANSELGGLRTVETVYDINRNAAAADVTEINTDFLTYGGSDGTPVANLDRNPLGTR